ncbi:MAG: hypothetical protein H6553_06795 [Chitinophagales bacterium]|nr:hypothetical protein [Chitinophagales bacterium]
MKRFFNLFTIAIISLIMWSCSKNDNSSKVPITQDSCEVLINQRKANPSIVQNPNGRFSYTHRQVKFKIKSYKEIESLEQNGITLLDHNFDAVPDKNLNYTTTHTNQYGVFYAIVPRAFNLSNYNYDVVDYRNIATTNKRVASKVINGNIEYYDPIAQENLPLQGVKVLVKDQNNINSSFADADGNFYIDASYFNSDTIEVLIQFNNNEIEVRTFNINNLGAVVNPNTFSLGFKTSCAFTNMQISIGSNFKNSKLHSSIASFVSYYQIKQVVANNQLQLPNKKLIFWLDQGETLSDAYSTPMLNVISKTNPAAINLFLEDLINLSPELANLVAPIVKDILPDITVPYIEQQATVIKISAIETIHHEFGHAIHYAKAGNDFWVPYIVYIFANGGYGYQSLPNSGIIALSEGWAEDFSYLSLYETYQKENYLINAEKENTTSGYWIIYGLYYDLFDNATNETFDNVSNISIKQVYQLLSTDVNTPVLLKNKLKTNYPTQATAIEQLFNHHGY